MARAGIYTPQRRLVMQLGMWVVFAVTMGMAGLVVYSQKRARHVDLAPAMVASNVSIRLPAKWRPRQQLSEDGVIAQASESAGRSGGRILTIYRDTLRSPVSAQEYLAGRFHIDFGNDDPGDELELTRNVRGQYPWVIVSTMRAVQMRDDGPATKELYAGTVLPSGHAVAMRLEGPGEADEGDFAVLSEVAQAMEFREEPALGPANEVVTLGDAVRVSAPAEFRFIQQSDRNLKSRRLWYQGAGSEAGEWRSIELIGCLLATGEGGAEEADFKSQISTMLIARDTRWRNAPVTVRPQGQYQAVPPAFDPADVYPTHAFVQTDASGHAVLAIIRCPGDLAESYWSPIQQSLKFTGSAEIPRLVKAGAEEIARLRELPLDRLLSEREDEWHLFASPSGGPPLGWSRIEWKPNQLSAHSECQWLLPQLNVRVEQDWTVSPDFNRFDCKSRRQVRTRLFRPVDQRQSVTLLGDALTLSTAGSAPDAVKWRRTAPPNYIPGPVLMELVQKLSPGQMLLKTESFLLRESIAPPDLMTLIVRTEEAPPGRQVTIEINGTGEMTRWNINSEGKVTSVDLPGGFQRLESSEKDIRLEFTEEQEAQ